jgi:hypothetical protein
MAKTSASGSTFSFHRIGSRPAFRKWPHPARDRAEAIQMLLPMRSAGWNGDVSQKNVRAAEIRKPLVGGFMSQARGHACDIDGATDEALRRPDSSHIKRGR